MLADLAEAEAAVEQAHRVGVVLEEHLARQLRVAQFGVALGVGVEGTAHAAAAATAGDDDAVDVEEALAVLAEPLEVAAVVVGGGAEPDQEPRQRAVALGDAEVLGGVVELAEAGRVQRQDRRASGVVEGEDGIQLVLAHVADDDRHS